MCDHLLLGSLVSLTRRIRGGIRSQRVISQSINVKLGSRSLSVMNSEDSGPPELKMYDYPELSLVVKLLTEISVD